jgi:translation initiation factor 2B subunit (eIF-2B alpha/beta/delta family)
VKAGAAVATCSYGSAVARLCKYAAEARKQLRVVVLEMGAEPMAYGRRLAAELGEQGVHAEVVDVAGLAAASGGVQAGFIGADAVTMKCVVNGTPSLDLAKAAQGRFPLYAVCESVKLIRSVPAEAGYDEVPLELFAGVVTESRVLTPSDVRRLMVF